MSNIEFASSVSNETINNEQEQEQEQNSDFVYWINSFNFEENSSLNYPFDKWQTLCAVFWIFIFIICAIILILISRK